MRVKSSQIKETCLEQLGKRPPKEACVATCGRIYPFFPCLVHTSMRLTTKPQEISKRLRTKAPWTSEPALMLLILKSACHDLPWFCSNLAWQSWAPYAALPISQVLWALRRWKNDPTLPWDKESFSERQLESSSNNNTLRKNTENNTSNWKHNHDMKNKKENPHC